MAKLCFVTAQGKRIEVEAEPGISAMQAAVSHGVLGILGDCGGACQCATCHVYVAEPWSALLPAVEGAEDAMLDGTAEARQPGSRLSCCLILRAALDGLVLQLPRSQI